MIPNEILPKTLRLPKGPKDGIVIVTGGPDLHFEHFALRIQQAFPNQVRGWFSPRLSVRTTAEKFETLEFNKELLFKIFNKSIYYLDQYRFRNSLGNFEKEKEKLFAEEVHALKAYGENPPREVNSLNAKQTEREIKDLDSYFLVVLGGPILKKRILKSVRGVAVNQHSGFAPHVKGARSIEIALYHRRLDWLANTVHLMTSEVDFGAILDRGSITITKDITMWECFFRSIRLGTEMVVDALQKIYDHDTIDVYPQPEVGTTYRSQDVVRAMTTLVAKDFANGWHRSALDLEIKL